MPVRPIRWLHRRQHLDLDRRGMAARQARLGPHTLSYRIGGGPREGGGNPVLFVQGFGGDAVWMWHPQATALLAHRTVVLPDLLWMGRSHSTARPSLEAQAQALLALLDHEGLDQVDVVSLSYGGFVAFELARLAPARVGKLVIAACPGPIFDEDDHARLRERLGVPDVVDVLVPGEAEHVRPLFRACLHLPLPLPRLIVQDFYLAFFSTFPAERRALMSDLFERQGQNHDWHRPPSLVLWGASDGLFEPGLAQRLGAFLEAEVHVLPRAAHALQLEQPRAFNRRMMGFLLEGGR